MIDSDQSLSARSDASQPSAPTTKVHEITAEQLTKLRAALIMLLSTVEDTLGYQRSVPNKKQRTGRL